jgi:hypothetical protein
MACGDMFGEYGFFKGVGVAEVDASDISEGQRAKFFAALVRTGVVEAFA